MSKRAKYLSIAILFSASHLLLSAAAASGALLPELKCQKARFNAAAKYLACHQKVVGKFNSGGFAGYLPFQAPISKCRVKYQAAWAKMQADAAGSGSTCDQARFTDNGDGTVTDNLTALVWEKKDDLGGIHDKDNLYTWSPGSPYTESGTVFSTFLPTLNTAPGFAGAQGWRLPTLAELQTIVSEAYPCATSPCVDPALLPTASGIYWSATSPGDTEAVVWDAQFATGEIFLDFKTSSFIYARAVRGGL